MTLIGLTGGIASGKTLVGSIFAESGAYIIDADRLAHEVVLPDTPGWEEVVQVFGIEILDQNRVIDRIQLAEIAFHDPHMLEQLCDIIHPRVLAVITEQVQEIKDSDEKALVVVNVPLLIEVGWYEWCDIVVLVTLPYNLQIERLMKRNNLSLHVAEERISTQMPLAEKEEYADYIIDNSTTKENTRRQTLKIIEDIRQNLENPDQA